jgi:tight adherence protein C
VTPSGLAAGLLGLVAMTLAARHGAPPLPRRRAPMRSRPAGAGRANSSSRLEHLGAVLRRRVRLDGSPLSDRTLAIAHLSVVPASVVAPPLGALVILGIWSHARIAAQRARRRRSRAVARGLPDSVDLFLLCTGAGLSLPLAHPLVAERSPAPLGDALAAAHRAAEGGRPRADALLLELAPLGDRALALGRVLVDHLRYGVPLAPGLERLGLELRLDRRRTAEQEARKVPVRLLAPLVTCVLPAFALLTVVPLLAGSLQALPT